jgi:hypothetical protein
MSNQRTTRGRGKERITSSLRFHDSDPENKGKEKRDRDHTGQRDDNPSRPSQSGQASPRGNPAPSPARTPQAPSAAIAKPPPMARHPKAAPGLGRGIEQPAMNSVPKGAIYAAPKGAANAAPKGIAIPAPKGAIQAAAGAAPAAAAQPAAEAMPAINVQPVAGDDPAIQPALQGNNVLLAAQPPVPAPDMVAHDPHNPRDAMEAPAAAVPAPGPPIPAPQAAVQGNVHLVPMPAVVPHRLRHHDSDSDSDLGSDDSGDDEHPTTHHLLKRMSEQLDTMAARLFSLEDSVGDIGKDVDVLKATVRQQGEDVVAATRGMQAPPSPQQSRSPSDFAVLPRTTAEPAVRGILPQREATSSAPRPLQSLYGDSFKTVGDTYKLGETIAKHWISSFGKLDTMIPMDQPGLLLEFTNWFSQTASAFDGTQLVLILRMILSPALYAGVITPLLASGQALTAASALAAIRNWFALQTSPVSFYDTIRSLRQRTGETVAQYNARVLTLVHSAASAGGEFVIQDAAWRSAYTQGLSDARVYQEVARAIDRSTLHDLMAMAARMDLLFTSDSRFQVEGQGKKNPGKSGQQDLSPPQPSKPSPSPTTFKLDPVKVKKVKECAKDECNNCFKKGHFQKDCKMACFLCGSSRHRSSWHFYTKAPGSTMLFVAEDFSASSHDRDSLANSEDVQSSQQGNDQGSPSEENMEDPLVHGLMN